MVGLFASEANAMLQIMRGPRVSHALLPPVLKRPGYARSNAHAGRPRPQKSGQGYSILTGLQAPACSRRRIGARDTRQRRWARLTNWPGLDAHRAPRWECLPCRVEDVIPPTYLALTLTLWTCSPHYSWFSSGAGWRLRPTKNPSDLAMARQARGTG
jgi:hypothetical protein